MGLFNITFEFNRMYRWGVGVFNRKFKFPGTYRISFFRYSIFDFCNKTLFALQYSLTVLMTLIGGGWGYAIFH